MAPATSEIFNGPQADAALPFTRASFRPDLAGGRIVADPPDEEDGE